MQVGAALTYVGLANLDRVAIIPFGDGAAVDRLPPSRGKNRIFRVFEFLRSVRDRRQDRARRVHEDVRHAEQAARPRRRDQRLLRSGRLRAGPQHAPLPQVRAVRAPGLRPARGAARAARRPRARRLRDRRDARGHRLRVAARGLRARAREVLRGARELLHGARDAVLSRRRRRPVRRARAAHLPRGGFLS